MIRFDLADASLESALKEILKEIPNSDSLVGTVCAEPIEKGLSVRIENGHGTLGYSSRASLCRAFGIYVANIEKESFYVEQTPDFDTVGMMADVSRNAVLTNVGT